MPETVAFRFDVTNPRAERAISERSSEQITAITDTTRDAARAVIEHGYAAGRGPNDIALDLIGRINRATGDREGGIIGLTAPQVSAALNLRDRLLSGDASEMSKVLGMGLRDKRFDSTIQKAIDEGDTLPADQVDSMYRQYVNNSLRFRGEAIARTETGQAVLEASHEAFQQGLEKTGYTNNAVTKTWRTANDNKVRDSHAAMDGQTVRGIDGVFESPESGARFLYPMDDSLGAGAGEIIQCRCLAEYNIDFSEGLKPDRELGGLPPAPAPLPVPEPEPTPSPIPLVPELPVPEPNVIAADLAVAILDRKLQQVVADIVDGLQVRKAIPNLASIEAGFTDYELLSGVREVPMSDFDATYIEGTMARKLDKRTQGLMEEIQASQEINPLIVAYDDEGAYIVEGGHRFDALIKMNKKKIPAKVVIDTSGKVRVG